MSQYNLSEKNVAVVVTDGFEPSEFTEPVKALREAGASVRVISIHEGEIKGKGGEPTVQVDALASQVTHEEFHALLLPGGVANPDTLRTDGDAVALVKSFFTAGKPVGAICHGPQVLIEADVVRGRKLTSFPSVKTDLINAGADWVDEEVVVDQGLVTSRQPDDLPAFNAKLLEEIAEGVHAGQHA
ncbi:MAG: type 1 glutamine amidotransferase domain-containing protein [Opitutales bacterium]